MWILRVGRLECILRVADTGRILRVRIKHVLWLGDRFGRGSDWLKQPDKITPREPGGCVMLKAFYVAASLLRSRHRRNPPQRTSPLYFSTVTPTCVSSPSTNPRPRARRSSRSRAPYRPRPPKLRNGSTSLTATPVSILRTPSAAFASTPGVRPKMEHQYSSGRATKSATRWNPHKSPGTERGARAFSGFG